MPRLVLLLVVAVLTALVLVLTAGNQIYDSNLYLMTEVTALLAGDHPYRDFFEAGVPLSALISALAQLAVGNRLIGEFAVQWLMIIAGTVMAFDLGRRLSGSIVAPLVMLPVVLVVLAATPTYHATKLLIYPLTVWLSWRYLELPSIPRAAALGVLTAVAFLLRHDHGVHVAAGAAVAFVLARLVRPSSRSMSSAFAECGVAAGTALVLVAPWLVFVQMNEGLREYVEVRASTYSIGATNRNPYRALLALNPVRTLRPADTPPPTPGVVSFEWEPDLTDAERQECLDRYGLRLVREPDADGRWVYEVANRYDPELLRLEQYADEIDGLDLDQLENLSSSLPVPNALVWLHQMTLLVPLILLIAAGLEVARNRWRQEAVGLDPYLLVSAAALLVVVDTMLFRQDSYFVVVAPITAALTARLLTGPARSGPGTMADGRKPLPMLLLGASRAIALTTVVVTTIVAALYARGTDIFELRELARRVPRVMRELAASPPIDGYQPAEPVRQYDREAWLRGQVDKGRAAVRYLHDCTAPGDRIFVTGNTPFHISYYVGRPIAGGQLHWRYGLRSEPTREERLLALLQRQSVPFAYSTNDPVLNDLARHPRIREHIETHYAVLEGSGGLLLYDTRRTPTGQYGKLGFPCFR